MAKTFNVDQLRVGNGILRSVGSLLYYDDQLLASENSAINPTTEITAGNGLKFAPKFPSDTGPIDTARLVDERTFYINFDDLTLGMGAVGTDTDRLVVLPNGITETHVNTSIAGGGLQKAAGEKMKVGLGVGAAGGLGYVSDDIASNDYHLLRVKEGGIYNAMLNGSISNDKLLDLERPGMVKGIAVQRAGSSLTNDNGLKISKGGVLIENLDQSVAGNGLNVSFGQDGYVSELFVGQGPGITVAADYIRVAVNGIENDMIIDNTITNIKLKEINTPGKVHGIAVQLLNGGGLANNNGLYIEDKAIGRDEFNAQAIARIGLNGTPDGFIDVEFDAGGGLGVSAEDKLLIKSQGVLNSMISTAIDTDLTKGISEDKLQGNIPLTKINFTAGDGLVKNGNDLRVNVGDGLEIDGDKVEVNSSVVRTTLPDANGNQILQTLIGDYKFTKVVNFGADVVIAGNVSIGGQTEVVNSNQVNIGDSLILLNSDLPDNIAPTEMGGIQIKRGSDASDKDARIIFDELGGDLWKLGQEGYESEILTFPRKVVDTEGADTTYRGVFSMSKAVNVGVTRVRFEFDAVVNHVPVFVMENGVSTHKPFKFHAIPTVIVSLQNTSTQFYGGYTLEADGVTQTPIDPKYDGRSDLVGCMVSKVDQYGFTVDFTTDIPGLVAGNVSDYFLNAYICSVDVSPV